MAEKASKPPPVAGLRPVPMKLFATWEVDRTPPNCIPRLCSLTLSRLVVLKTLGSDLASITIAVKMQGSKRTLRSNEMVLPPNGLLDTELQLNFSLQYPHFLKQDGNKLHVMLQRRKRYKNRTILGYKTLAEGVINMSQVLQRQMDLELDLVTDMKEPKNHSNVVARVSVQALNSQPVDHEETTKHSGRVAEFSDEDEEFSSNEEGSDSEPMLEERRSRKSKIPVNARQRNLKQRFISLLKRFRVNEDLQGLETERGTIGRNISGTDMDPADIEDLFEELEDMSDSGPEVDTMSISSTPKPSLRPFFSSSRSLLHDTLNVPGRPHPHLGLLSPLAASALTPEKPVERLSDESSKKADSDSHPENWTDSDPPPPTAPLSNCASSPPKNSADTDRKENIERERKNRLFARDRNSSSSVGKSSKKSEKTSGAVLSPSQIQPDSNIAEPRKVVVEQLLRVLPSEDCVPEQLILVNTGDPLGALLAAKLTERQHKVICMASSADVRATVFALVNKIQKLWKTDSSGKTTSSSIHRPKEENCNLRSGPSTFSLSSSCNSSPKPPSQIKLLLAGSDSFINCVLRHYVEQLSSKPPDWQTYIRFLVVPLGNNTLGRYLSSLDAVYNAAFGNESWKDLLEKGETNEPVNRIQRYLLQSNTTVNLPIAEAMLTYKEKRKSLSLEELSPRKNRIFHNPTEALHRLLATNRLRSDDESSQIFIPFMNDVRLGSPDNSTTTSVDLEEMFPPLISGSPPSSMNIGCEKRVTPPSSPNIGQSRELCEPLELQLDYWLLPGKSLDARGDVVSVNLDKKKTDSTKSSLKSTFRSLQVARLPLLGEQPTPHFTISYSTKEKKQKIMRLGKKKEKEKENEPKNQVVEGVSRLIVSPKAQNIPLKLCIDGTEWSGVKFFQLSAQWQTHIRHFPVSLFSAADSSQL
ncbi:phosphofurin acidic cluster sorting protein 2 [Macrosteles quadrilineatus]|uniref:phosphofurin acidic cluster sorting protein 2 n=1 Tax=Macrosteles quadrilineatus TaxID=74068 RepID=UPI0023E0A74F|nr:phosphofurin acidic cluster sorting protein 2 [Macrosteles quadrilineatus]